MDSQEINPKAIPFKRDALLWASRAVELDRAIRALRLPYTYMLATERNKKHEQLGGVSADILEGMRDHFMDNAVQGWINAKNIREGGDIPATQIPSELRAAIEALQPQSEIS